MGKFKASIIDKLGFRLNVLLLLGLLLTYPVPYLNPEHFWFMALLGLAYPIFVSLTLICVAWWLFRKKWKYLLANIVVIVLGGFLHLQSFAVNVLPAEFTAEKSMKVMSYNVQNFDLYNWTENLDSRNKIIKLIQTENPDVICFQEFYTEEESQGDFHNVKLLVNDLGYQHYHFEKTLTLKTTKHWGIAIFSKFPIENSAAVKFSNSKNNVAVYADIKADSLVFRLFNTHLQSIHLGRADLEYVKNITKGAEEGKEKDHIKASKSIIEKLKAAYQKRGAQARILAKELKKSPYPTIICGDFNDTPTSYTYKTIRQDLKDTFLETNFGVGGTYAGPIPALRIDYALVDTIFQVKSFNVLSETYSDHYPIVTTIGY
ncbi:MAG: endonuclease/exonuclease/phosphatase family protein [Chitinophagales bacterium]